MYEKPAAVCKGSGVANTRLHKHLPVALQRLGHADRGAGEPGPASGVAASGTQRSPARGGRPTAPEAAPDRPTAPRLRYSRKM